MHTATTELLAALSGLRDFDGVALQRASTALFAWYKVECPDLNLDTAEHWNHPPRLYKDGEPHPLWPHWVARVKTSVGGWRPAYQAWWERSDKLCTQPMTGDGEGPLQGLRGPGLGYWAQVGPDAELARLDAEFYLEESSEPT